MNLPSVDKDKKTAKVKLLVAAGAGAVTAGLAVVSAPLVLTGAAAAGTAYFVYDWFKFRAKRGMRF
jgi:hypothetical protein